MKNTIKGQAMTELVIVLPVFLLMLGGIYKFTLMGIHKIQLEMTAREVMRYIADGADFGEDMQAIGMFAKEAGARNGLKRENISGPEQTSKTAKGDFGNNKLADGVVSKFSGVEFSLFYKEELNGLFWKMTGMTAPVLSTKLATASGGSFAVTWKTIVKNNPGSTEGAGPVVDYDIGTVKK